MQLRGAAKLTARLPHGAMRNGHAGLRCGTGLGHAGDLLRLRGLRQTGYIAECEAKKVRELIPYK